MVPNILRQIGIRYDGFAIGNSGAWAMVDDDGCN